MGSKFGWILAGILLVGVAVIVLLRVVYPHPTLPTSTTLVGDFLEMKTVGVPPAEVLGYEPKNAPGNAADDYHRAVLLCESKAERLDGQIRRMQEILRGSSVPDTAQLAILKQINDHVAAGAAKKQMQYVFVYTPRKFRVGIFHFPPADKLLNVGDCLHLLGGYYLVKKRHDEAEKVLHNEFMLGLHMMREKRRTAMVECGIGLQIRAIGMLVDVHRARGGEHAGRIAGLSRYREGLNELSDAYDKVKQAVWQYSEPGDVLNIAENHKDRAWRIQGILALGMIRHHPKCRGDSRYADKLIEKYSSGGDELEAAAANAARELTETQFIQLGDK